MSYLIKKPIILVMVLLGFSLWVEATYSDEAAFEEICIRPGVLPSIDGNKIVYTYSPADGSPALVYLYDLGSNGRYDGVENDLQEGDFLIAGGAEYSQYDPVISGNKIIWRDYQDGYYQVFLYDLGSNGRYDGVGNDLQEGKFQLTHDPSTKYHPNISGNRIVWYDKRNGNYDIYLYDLGANGRYDGAANDSQEGEVQITTDPNSQFASAISGDKIVWQDYRENGRYDAYMYDLVQGKEFQITSQAHHYNVDISGNKIVYEYEIDGFRNIRVYDLGSNGRYDGAGNDPQESEFQITSDPSYQYEPSISGNKITWYERRDWTYDGRYDIYVYDLGPDGQGGTADDLGEVKLTAGVFNNYFPQISDNKVVYYHDGSIYLVDLGTDQPQGGDGGKKKIEQR